MITYEGSFTILLLWWWLEVRLRISIRLIWERFLGCWEIPIWLWRIRNNWWDWSMILYRRIELRLLILPLEIKMLPNAKWCKGLTNSDGNTLILVRLSKSFRHSWWLCLSVKIMPIWRKTKRQSSMLLSKREWHLTLSFLRFWTLSFETLSKSGLTVFLCGVKTKNFYWILPISIKFLHTSGFSLRKMTSITLKLLLSLNWRLIINL